jgi:hypothetical protein
MTTSQPPCKNRFLNGSVLLAQRRRRARDARVADATALAVAVQTVERTGAGAGQTFTCISVTMYSEISESCPHVALIDNRVSGGRYGPHLLRRVEPWYDARTPAARNCHHQRVSVAVLTRVPSRTARCRRRCRQRSGCTARC